jgi:hypothetical protein
MMTRCLSVLIATLVAALIAVAPASAANAPVHLTAAHGAGTTDQSSEFEVENGDFVQIATHNKNTNGLPPAVPQVTFTAGTWENFSGASLVYDNVGTTTRGRMDVNQFQCVSGCGDDVDVRANFSYGTQSQAATGWSIDNHGPNVSFNYAVNSGVNVTSLTASPVGVQAGDNLWSFAVHQVTEDTNATTGDPGSWTEVANEDGGAASMALAWAPVTATGPDTAGASWATASNGGIIAVQVR